MHDIDALARQIISSRQGQSRMLVAVAGAPASGKSTLAEHLTEAISRQGVRAQLVPMDGFHLDNRILEARGLLPRKGAPETFDAEGFIALVSRLRSPREVIVPGFDRARDISVAGMTVVPADCEIVVVEGNYLLFDEDPWRQLADLWDMSVRLDVAEPVLRQRLVERWLSYGLTPEAAMIRAEGNDLPNARRIIARQLPADLTI